MRLRLLLCVAGAIVVLTSVRGQLPVSVSRGSTESTISGMSAASIEEEANTLAGWGAGLQLDRAIYSTEKPTARATALLWNFTAYGYRREYSRNGPPEGCLFHWTLSSSNGMVVRQSLMNLCPFPSVVQQEMPSRTLIAEPFDVDLALLEPGVYRLAVVWQDLGGPRDLLDHFGSFPEAGNPGATIDLRIRKPMERKPGR